MTKSNNYTLVILLMVTVFIIFSNLGTVPLLDPDEPVYAETPKEMILYNEFVSPRIYGEYWYDKPPMYYWLVAASYQVFGVNDFAARFPSAILAVLCVGALYCFVRKIINARAGLISAFVLATSIEFFYLGKAAVTDITLTLFLTLSLLCFIRQKYYLFYAFTGLATLTKGPIGLFFPVVIVFLYLLISRNLSEIKRMKVFSGSIVFMIIAAPWYFMMYQLHGSDFINTFLGFHNVTRFTSPEHPSGVLWYYYLPVLIIGFFPWSAVLLQSVYKTLFGQCSQFKALLFFNIWAATVFLFFSISQTKLVSYILPMFPALSIIVGWYIDHLWSQQRHYAKRQYAWSVLLGLLTILFSIGSFLGIQALPAIENGVYALIGVFAFLLVTTTIFIFRKNIAMLFYAQVFGMVLLAAVVSYSLFPAVAPNFSVYQTVNQFKVIYDGKSPIYVSKFLRPGFAFYSGHYGEELYFSETAVPDIEKILSLRQKSYFVIRDIDYARIAEPTRNKLQIEQKVDNKFILSTK